MNKLRWEHKPGEGTHTGCFCFTLERDGHLLPLAAWVDADDITTARGAGSVGALLARLGTDGVSEAESIDDDALAPALLVTDQTLAELAHQEPAALQALGLPDCSPYRLRLSEQSALGTPNFRVKTRFFDGTRPVTGVKRMGPLLDHAGRQYILPAPLHQLLEGIDRFNVQASESTGREQFLAYRALLLPEWPSEAFKSGQLARLEVIYADSFTLDLQGPADFTPRLRYRPVTHPDQLQPNTPRDALPSEASEAFSRRFDEASHLKSGYALDGSRYLFLSPRLEKALTLVKQVRAADESHRMAFIANPTAFLASAHPDQDVTLPEDHARSEDEITEIFEETRPFLSERIKYLGEWIPKARVYHLPSGTDWFPSECVGIPWGESMLKVEIDQLRPLADEAKDASTTGETHIEIDGHLVPLNSDIEQRLREAAESYEPRSRTQGGAYPVGKSHLTSGGVAVRSKSELLIANAMEAKGIRYAYERPLHGAGASYSPDFTIPYDGQEYYWEHLGMLSDESYHRRWQRKERWYRHHFPEQLITTEEGPSLSGDIVRLLDERFPLGVAGQPADWDAGQKSPQKPPQLVPVLHDNLDELGYVDPLRDGDVSPQDVIIPENLCSTLKAHQRAALRQLQMLYNVGYPGMLLADDMGLGKTLQALCFMRWLKEAAPTEVHTPQLVVAPSTLLHNWEAEAKKHFKGGLGSVCHARGQQFSEDQMRAADWVLTTYETVRDQVNKFTTVPWQVVVFDECQKIKNPAARMTQMAKSLKADFKLMMTGTPIENSFDEFWCIMDTAYSGYLDDLKTFRREFSDPFEAGDATPVEKLRHRLERRGLLLRRMKGTTLEGLPSREVRNYPEHMSARQAKAYDEALRQAQQERAERGAILQALHKLRRVSLLVDPLEPMGITREFMQEHARLKALEHILNTLPPDEKALIFCEWLDVQGALKSYLARRFPSCGTPLLINGNVNIAERQRRVQSFQQQPENRLMILSQKVGGVGLTLTEANHVIHLTRWWNPAVEDQCNDRIYRIGQRKDVIVHLPQAEHPRLGIEGSFDGKLHALLEKKRARAHQLAPTAIKEAELFDALLWHHRVDHVTP